MFFFSPNHTHTQPRELQSSGCLSGRTKVEVAKKKVRIGESRPEADNHCSFGNCKRERGFSRWMIGRIHVLCLPFCIHTLPENTIRATWNIHGEQQQHNATNNIHTQYSTYSTYVVLSSHHRESFIIVQVRLSGVLFLRRRNRRWCSFVCLCVRVHVCVNFVVELLLLC